MSSHDPVVCEFVAVVGEFQMDVVMVVSCLSDEPLLVVKTADKLEETIVVKLECGNWELDEFVRQGDSDSVEETVEDVREEFKGVATPVRNCVDV